MSKLTIITEECEELFAFYHDGVKVHAMCEPNVLDLLDYLASTEYSELERKNFDEDYLTEFWEEEYSNDYNGGEELLSWLPMELGNVKLKGG